MVWVFEFFRKEIYLKKCEGQTFENDKQCVRFLESFLRFFLAFLCFLLLIYFCVVVLFTLDQVLDTCVFLPKNTILLIFTVKFGSLWYFCIIIIKSFWPSILSGLSCSYINFNFPFFKIFCILSIAGSGGSNLQISFGPSFLNFTSSDSYSSTSTVPHNFFHFFFILCKLWIRLRSWFNQESIRMLF